MKKIGLALVMLMGTTFSYSQVMKLGEESLVKLSIDSDRNSIDTMLSTFWRDIDYKYSLDDMSVMDKTYDLFDSPHRLKVDVSDINIDLGKQGEKLFSIVPLGDNRLQILWHLDNLKASARLKASITGDYLDIGGPHDSQDDKPEVYIEFKGVDKVETIAKVGTDENGDFDLDIEKAVVELTAPVIKGNDRYTKLVLDLVDFLEVDLDLIIQEYLNEMLIDELSDEALLGDLEDRVKEEVREFEATKIPVGDLATKLLLRLDQFEFTKDRLNLNVGVRFDNKDSRVHSCVQGMYQKMQAADMMKGGVLAPYDVVEQIVTNLMLFEVDQNNDGVPDEPLLCFGYERYDDNGEPAGELETISYKLLGKRRNINFKFWAAPTSIPNFTYMPETNSIKVEVDAKLIVKNAGDDYPKIYLEKDILKTKLSGILRLRHDAVSEPSTGVEAGINLSLEDLKIEDLDVKVKVKLSKFTPKLPIPISLFKNTIEEELRESAMSDLAAENLIAQNTELLNLVLSLSGYELTEDGHDIKFKINAK